MAARKIHPDFQYHLDFKSKEVISVFTSLRNFILKIHPEANELLYHTHALTNVFSVSEKLGDAYCHIPIYSNHLNLGFNKGTLLKDPDNLLQGTGKLIRHIPITEVTDFKNKKVEALIRSAIEFSVSDMKKESKVSGTTISKIKVIGD